MSNATAAIDDVVARLGAYGITATRDAGAFYPQPTGVLVGLPELVDRTLGGMWTFTVPVTVVSGDPLSDELAVDRLYGLADAVAAALRTNAYRPTSFRSNASAEPLPAIELGVTVTAQEA